MKRLQSIETVKHIFLEYLERKNYRKTPERFALIDEIYSLDAPFDAETLHDRMEKRKYRVSKATIYNTLELLLECNLILKENSSKQQAYFKKTSSCEKLDHVVCTSCNEIIEFCDYRIQEIQDTVAHLMNYQINTHSLYFYGLCSKCREKQAQKKLLTMNNNQDALTKKEE